MLVIIYNIGFLKRIFELGLVYGVRAEMELVNAFLLFILSLFVFVKVVGLARF